MRDEHYRRNGRNGKNGTRRGGGGFGRFVRWDTLKAGKMGGTCVELFTGEPTCQYTPYLYR